MMKLFMTESHREYRQNLSYAERALRPLCAQLERTHGRSAAAQLRRRAARLLRRSYMAELGPDWRCVFDDMLEIAYESVIEALETAARSSRPRRLALLLPAALLG